MEVWEKREIAWEHEHEVRVFPRNFEFLPNFHKCFYNSIGTRKKCFLFPLLNSLLKTIKKINLLILIILNIVCILFFKIPAQFTQPARKFPCFYRVIETQVFRAFDQSTPVFLKGYFINTCIGGVSVAIRERREYRNV